MGLFQGLAKVLKGWNDFLKDAEQMPKKLFQGEFYEEEKRPVPCRQKYSNKVRIEDLKPAPRHSESA